MVFGIVSAHELNIDEGASDKIIFIFSVVKRRKRNRQNIFVPWMVFIYINKSPDTGSSAIAVND